MKYQIAKHDRMWAPWALYKEVDGEWKQQGMREHSQRDLMQRIPLSFGTIIEICDRPPVTRKDLYGAALACVRALDSDVLEGRDQDNPATLAVFAHLQRVSGIEDFLELYPREIDNILLRAGDPDSGDSPENRADRMADAIFNWRRERAEEARAELEEFNKHEGANATQTNPMQPVEDLFKDITYDLVMDLIEDAGWKVANDNEKEYLARWILDDVPSLRLAIADGTNTFVREMVTHTDQHWMSMDKLPEGQQNEIIRSLESFFSER